VQWSHRGAACSHSSERALLCWRAAAVQCNVRSLPRGSRDSEPSGDYCAQAPTNLQHTRQQ